MREAEIRRTVTNKLAGLRYDVKVMRDGTVVVESGEAYESIDRMKRNISGRIPGIEFVGQNTRSRMNWGKMSMKHGLPTMGKEETECAVKFKFKEES